MLQNLCSTFRIYLQLETIYHHVSVNTNNCKKRKNDVQGQTNSVPTEEITHI